MPPHGQDEHRERGGTFFVVKKGVVPVFVVKWPPNLIIVATRKGNHCPESDGKLAPNIIDKNIGTLAPAVEYFQKVTTSYWDGLFQCYQVKDLPRTNNDLEHFFGTARHAERHATGRKRASPTLVVRGSVRVVVAGASRILSISAADLRSSNVTAWRALRQTLDYRQEGRRRQLRFRRDPQTYLASLEERLCRPGLPS